MILSFRSKHERLLREIYRRDGTPDEQKLSFFKHYLQQKPMKIAESMVILKEYAKKYALAKEYSKHLTTLVISAHLFQNYTMFCTSFEAAALRLLKTHLKELLKLLSPSEPGCSESFLSSCCEEVKACFSFFTYAGTRSSRAEKISTHIFLALCNAIDAGFTSIKKEKEKTKDIYDNIAKIYASKWPSLSSVQLRKAEELELEAKEDEDSYNTESSFAYHCADTSCNYTEDKSGSSSSSFFTPEQNPGPPILPLADSDTPPVDEQVQQELPQSDGQLQQEQTPGQSWAASAPEEGKPIPAEVLNALSSLSASQSTLPLSIRNGISIAYISPDKFVVHSCRPNVEQVDSFLLCLLSIVVKAPGLLLHHTEKKLQALNQALVKAAPFNISQRHEIFTLYFHHLPPTIIPVAVRQVLELGGERKIAHLHNILYSTVSTDIYADIIIQSNTVMAHYRTKIFSGQNTDALRYSLAFILYQTTDFINSAQVTIPPARMTGSYYLLLRVLFPKKTLFRKVVLTEEDFQERGLIIKYFKLFLTRCQDKEIVFLSLLRCTFQKELGIGASSIPADLKLLIARELEQNLLETDKCTCLPLFEHLLDIAASPLLQFRENIHTSLGTMVEKEILGKKSQFEETKRVRVFARIRTLAVTQGGIYVTLLKKAVPTVPISEVKIITGVFATIQNVSGLEECSKYIDISEGAIYNLEEDNKLCNRNSSVQESSARSGTTTFGGVRKSSIRLLDIFKKLNK